jgi:hypothetical protein
MGWQEPDPATTQKCKKTIRKGITTLINLHKVVNKTQLDQNPVKEPKVKHSKIHQT